MTWEEINRIQNLKPEKVILFGNNIWLLEKDGWINIDPSYVVFVLERLKTIFEEWFDFNEINKKKITFVFEKTDEKVPTAFPNEGIISLSMDSGFNDGCRIIYQAAHELLHVFLGCRKEYKLPYEYKWFEEVLCELASQNALNHNLWQSFLSFNNDFTNTVFTKNYLSDNIENKAIKFKEKLIIKDYELSIDNLSKDPCMRDVNNFIAHEIRNAINTTNKSFWDCIKIFSEIDGKGIPIRDSLVKWYNIVHGDEREIVEKVIGVFECILKQEIKQTNFAI
jgi:hypothetical protein